MLFALLATDTAMGERHVVSFSASAACCIVCRAQMNKHNVFKLLERLQDSIRICGTNLKTFDVYHIEI